LARVPRVSRLIALALKFQGLLSEGTVRNHVQLAELGEVTRTRVCQILRLTNLAPTIQEALLFLPKTLTGPDRMTENRFARHREAGRRTRRRTGASLMRMSGEETDETEAAIGRTIESIRRWSDMPITIQFGSAGRKASTR
jgi:hypothetical protein